MLDRELAIRFTYHPPTGDQPQLYQQIRNNAKTFAEAVDQLAPDGREKSLALTHIEGAVMWANAAIARSQARAEQDES